MSGRTHPLPLLLLSALLAGCHPGQPPVPESGSTVNIPVNHPSTPVSAMPPDVATVVATVGGETITQQSLAAAIKRTFGETAAGYVDAGVTDKVLDSLIRQRALAVKAEKELGSEALAEINEEVALFREELLIKKQVTEKLKGKITEARIEAFYRANLAQFGQSRIKRYEVLKTVNAPEGEQGVAAKHFLTQAKTNPAPWQEQVGTANKQGLLIQHLNGEADQNLLQPSLKTALARLDVGQTTEVLELNGDFFLLRINEEKVIPAKPLSTVKQQIRHTLALVDYKDAIAYAADEAMTGLEIRKMEH